MKDNRFQSIAVLSLIGFSIIIIGVTVFMTLKNNEDFYTILEKSIKSQLISTSIAAREFLDIEKFYSYNTMEDIENDIEAYEEVLYDLRSLKRRTGAEYIYALKLIDGKYYFIFDTDEEDTTTFVEYADISEVHIDAFVGIESAGVMNVVDEWGSFNTGAVPVYKDGRIIGIISVDTKDAYIQESIASTFRNTVFLIVTLIIALGTMILTVSLLLNSIQKQNRLFRMANYDVLTGLPNRQYLMSYLPEVAEKALKKGTTFAFLLIDLDNFKMVNDNEGHDAGDELLQQTAAYLDSIHDHSKIFKPTSGKLSVSVRLGGDEFVQILHGVHTIEEAGMIIQKMLDNYGAKTFNRFIEKYNVGMSIGIAMFPYHTENYNVLIKHADVAMYQAKRNGKNTYCVYDDEIMYSDGNEEPEKQDDPPPEQLEQPERPERRHRRR